VKSLADGFDQPLCSGGIDRRIGLVRADGELAWPVAVPKAQTTIARTK